MTSRSAQENYGEKGKKPPISPSLFVNLLLETTGSKFIFINEKQLSK